MERTIERDAFPARIVEVLPSTVAVAFWEGSDEPSLLAAEEEAIASAAPGRRLEFARGRWCAREALRRLGQEPVAIPVGPGRAPRWPNGYVGAITHAGDFVAASVVPVESIGMLGIDVERAHPLPSDVRSMVLHEREADVLARLGLPDTLAFSAKESLHKALFPRFGVWLDFLDVAFAPGSKEHFSFRSVTDAARSVSGIESMEGRYVVSERYLFTVCWGAG